MAGRGGQRKRARAAAEAAATAQDDAMARMIGRHDVLRQKCKELVDEWRTHARSGVDCAQQLEETLTLNT